jgi:tetratricopeptide (TPR) repeat protein
MAGLLRREVAYDRRRLLSVAAKARQKGKRKRAIEAYQRILEVDPNDTDVHRKVAPLLAHAGQHQAAMQSFAAAMKGLKGAGFETHALGVCREAIGFYPHQVALWEEIARLRLKAARAIDAVSTLLEGRKHFRRRKQLPEAIRLLELACEIDRENVTVSLDLCRLLKRSGQRDKARTILADLETRQRGRMLRKVRAAQFRNDPSLRTAWVFMRTAWWSKS